MKSRSHHHRLPAMDPTDDWVNGSWTVDCVCGVNFDDGEEMVDCDECGVWVHTRCSRYVKSEKSFACDKCKNRSSGNECEETEVAQLLVELPNKTLRMGSNSNNTCPPVGPPRHPFRLWTHRPMEERVHVQGVPGGEPSLFNGLSSIFTPELWKCTGHVPKKFNFKYREFSCWDKDVENEEENENPVDKGAGVLFSLSKDVSDMPIANTLIRKKGRVERDGCERLLALEDSKRCEGGNINVRPRQKDVRKDDTLLRSTLFQSGKRKKEDFVVTKDQTAKKKFRLVHKERDYKKIIATETSITASTPPSDAKVLIFHEANGPKIVFTDDQGAKNSDVDVVHSNPFSGDEDVAKNNVEKSSSNLASCEKLHENNDFDVSNKQSLSTGAGTKEEKGCHQVYTRFKDSLNSDSGVKYFVKNDDRGSTSLQKEAGVNDMNDSKRSPQSTEGDSKKSEAFPEKFISPSLEVVENEIVLEKTLNHKDKVKTGLGVDNGAKVKSSTECEAKIEETKSSSQPVGSSTTKHLDIKTDNMTVTSLRDLKVLGNDTSTDTVCKGQTDSPDIKRKMSHIQNTAHPSKISNKNAVPQAHLSAHHKSTENRRLSESKSHNSKTGISDSNNNTKKDKDRLEKSNNSIKRDRGNHEVSRKMLKEHPKSSLGSILKASESKRLSGSKYSDCGSSSKTPSNKNSGVNSGSGEPVSSLENQNMSHIHSKVSSLGSSLRGEKSNHSSSNSPMHLPASSNSPAILSDEELALLLHQELNSSPRVPRVPRVRQAGSVPQLGSPTGTTTFIKKTSSSGGRDQSVVAKRKDKDSAKTGSHSSENIDDETKDDFPLSPDRKNNKSLRAMDTLPKRERDSTRKGTHSVKRNAIPLSPTTRSTRPFSPSGASETKSGSTRHSLRNPSDDDEDEDNDDVKGPRHQTLPALLADIMAEGKRMTYEELCNSVLPHWPHLRKHNGERYAYSTHSQAVLDCLRNRQEWARLVDRGPKTNGNRKRRKQDTEPQSNDSEEDEYGGKDNSAEEIESGSLKSHQEEFPKGKRKARKRRRLPLQGRRAKDATSKCKTDSDDEDDNGSFSSSSEDSMFSDDMHGDSTS